MLGCAGLWRHPEAASLPTGGRTSFHGLDWTVSRIASLSVYAPSAPSLTCATFFEWGGGSPRLRGPRPSSCSFGQTTPAGGGYARAGSRGVPASGHSLPVRGVLVRVRVRVRARVDA